MRQATIHELQGVRMVRTVGVTLFGSWGACLSSVYPVSISGLSDASDNPA